MRAQGHILTVPHADDYRRAARTQACDPHTVYALESRRMRHNGQMSHEPFPSFTAKVSHVAEHDFARGPCRRRDGSAIDVLYIVKSTVIADKLERFRSFDDCLDRHVCWRPCTDVQVLKVGKMSPLHKGEVSPRGSSHSLCDLRSEQTR